MTSESEYETKAQLMIEKPQNYGLDEFSEIIVEVGMFNEQLSSELKETYIEEMERRDQDPSEEYDVVESLSA